LTDRSIAIRRLGEADAADYRAIRLAALQGAPEAFGSTYAVEAARPLSAFAERLAASTVVGAYAGRDIVGLAGFKRDDGEKHRHKGFVWGLYVRPDLRRRGLAALLMRRLLAEAAQTAEQVTLTVARGNDSALTLYKKLGFAVYGVEPRALRNASGYCDEILMVKFLRTE